MGTSKSHRHGRCGATLIAPASTALACVALLAAQTLWIPVFAVDPGSSFARLGDFATQVGDSAFVEPRPQGPTTTPEPDIFDRFDADFRKRVGTNNATVTWMMGMHENSNHDMHELSFSLYFNIFISLIVLLTFSFLRVWYPIIYAYHSSDANAHRNRAPGGFFGWIPAIAALTDEHALQASGLDGLMLFCYYRLSRRIMAVVGVLCTIVLFPTHYFLGEEREGFDMLSRVAIETLVIPPKVESPVPYWIHVAMVWVVVLTTLQQCYNEHCRYLELRFAWLCQLQRPQATTLLIENIPSSLCSDAALRGYFVKLFGENAIERAYIVRRTQHLRSLISDRNSSADALKESTVAWESDGQNPDRRPTTNGPLQYCCCQWDWGEDAIQFHSRQLKRFQSKVDAERRCIEDAVPLKDTGIAGVCSKSGFVTFTSRRACRLASREQFKPDAMVMMPKAPPPPDDVDYENIGKDPLIQNGQRWLFGVYVFAIFMVWLPVVASVGALVNFDEIMAHVSFIREYSQGHPTISIMMQSIVAASLLRFLMSLLPSTLMWGIKRFLTPKSGNDAQLMLQTMYYTFLLIFVLLITAITSSLGHTAKSLLDSPRSLFPLLARTLPAKSHWYTEYLILGWVTEVFELIRIGNLGTFLGWRLLLGPEEAKRRAEPQCQDYYGMGARMARCGLHLTVMLVFCTCFPPIALVGWVLFSISTTTRAYLAVYVETRLPDYGGEFWIEGLKFIMIALILFVVLMVGVLHEHSTYWHGLAALSSLLAILVYWRSLGNLVWQCLPFETIAEVDDGSAESQADGGAGVPIVLSYVQEECVPEVCREPDERLRTRQTADGWGFESA